MFIRVAICLVLVTLQSASWAQAVFVKDIGGDGKIGLEEAVYALQVAAEMRDDTDDIGLDSAIRALQIVSGMAPSDKNFPNSLSLFGSGLVFMAGVIKWRDRGRKAVKRLMTGAYKSFSLFTPMLHKKSA